MGVYFCFWLSFALVDLCLVFKLNFFFCNGGPMSIIFPSTAKSLTVTESLPTKGFKLKKKKMAFSFCHPPRLKTITITVQLSLQPRSSTASFTRRRLIVLTGKPSCKITALSRSSSIYPDVLYLGFFQCC